MDQESAGCTVLSLLIRGWPGFLHLEPADLRRTPASASSLRRPIAAAVCDRQLTRHGYTLGLPRIPASPRLRTIAKKLAAVGPFSLS